MNDSLATSQSGTLPVGVQCPFCFELNFPRDDDPLCVQCGLSIERLLRSRAPEPTVPQDPGAPLPKVKARKQRKKKRSQQPATVPGSALAPEVGLSWLQPTVTHPASLPVVAGPSLPDEAHEATVVFAQRDTDDTPMCVPATRDWVIELEAGHVVSLPSRDVVIGRHPDATLSATPVALPDHNRTLSRTHARLTFDASRDTWLIEDLESSNGVAIFDRDSHELTRLSPGEPTVASEYLLLGTLRARLRPAT